MLVSDGTFWYLYVPITIHSSTKSDNIFFNLTKFLGKITTKETLTPFYANSFAWKNFYCFLIFHCKRKLWDTKYNALLTMNCNHSNVKGGFVNHILLQRNRTEFDVCVLSIFSFELTTIWWQSGSNYRT